MEGEATPLSRCPESLEVSLARCTWPARFNMSGASWAVMSLSSATPVSAA